MIGEVEVGAVWAVSRAFKKFEIFGRDTRSEQSTCNAAQVRDAQSMLRTWS